MSAFMVQDQTINNFVSWLKLAIDNNSDYRFNGRYLNEIFEKLGYQLKDNDDQYKQLANDLFKFSVRGGQRKKNFFQF